MGIFRNEEDGSEPTETDENVIPLLPLRDIVVFPYMVVPLFVGRTAAALLAADDLMTRTGSIQWVEDLAEEFDLFDENGKRPPGYPRRLAGD